MMTNFVVLTIYTFFFTNTIHMNLWNNVNIKCIPGDFNSIRNLKRGKEWIITRAILI
jgi:hypothetical protein